MPEYFEPQTPEDKNDIAAEDDNPAALTPSAGVKSALQYLTSDGNFWNDVLESASEDERTSNEEFNSVMAYAHTFDIVHEFMIKYLRKFPDHSDREILKAIVEFIQSQREKPEAKRPSAYREAQTFCYEKIENALSAILRS